MSENLPQQMRLPRLGHTAMPRNDRLFDIARLECIYVSLRGVVVYPEFMPVYL